MSPAAKLSIGATALISTCLVITVALLGSALPRAPEFPSVAPPKDRSKPAVHEAEGKSEDATESSASRIQPYMLNQKSAAETVTIELDYPESQPLSGQSFNRLPNGE